MIGGFFMKKIQFTQEGYDKLKIEYDELVNKTRPKAVERLSKARAMGDLSENSEYVAAKEDLAFVEGRVKELEGVINIAVVVQEQQTDGSIKIGCKVLVEANGTEEEFTIVGEFEADPLAKKLSQTSPIGKALLGKKVGESVEVNVPIGKMKYKILRIE